MGSIPERRSGAWQDLKKPTHQISFHTEKALQTIRFVEGVRVYEE